MTDRTELRPAETVAETVPTRHEWYEFEDLTERNYPIPPIDAAFIAAASPAVVLGLLDRLAHMTEARDNARAEVERLTALLAEVRETAAAWSPDFTCANGCPAAANRRAAALMREVAS